MNISKDIRNDKAKLLKYFRERSNEFLSEVNSDFGNTEYKKKAKKLNTLLVKAKKTLIEIIEQKAKNENWTNQEILESVLMVTYCNYVVMLEVRHSVWEYEYMTFSRRIGELWEPFCKLAFEHPLNDLELFVPPLFSDVKKKLANEIEVYIKGLNISQEQKNQLDKYYNKVWGLVMSGEIQLELDLHFVYQGNKYVVDFKSGFGSNEKGNTNRLLLVASIYHNLEDNYQPLIFVRSDDNNNYFNTLKNSGIWSAFSGSDTYDQLMKFSGYDLRSWINSNIDWKHDLDANFVKYLEKNGLTQYLTW
jgi:succinate dehydrogenase flavin-adding protein (antitoxin of CptAB toxin-antitoxin module)